ncbi:hypothetical protein PgNI_10193 [Pyricularia grisea]|uniref:Uncharacterized protein n=1 Tax=Pyricularia grisea TaxID=148305 RepID=A0A6P8AZK7_PYRGI|nr:hypothetical protein PgNI_10193 [Pyricularia grisea]TLD07734.1 hypothetical protein PgNI_10193 [Pyricularia grisea]
MTSFHLGQASYLKATSQHNANRREVLNQLLDTGKEMETDDCTMETTTSQDLLAAAENDRTGRSVDHVQHSRNSWDLEFSRLGAIYKQPFRKQEGAQSFSAKAIRKFIVTPPNKHVDTKGVRPWEQHQMAPIAPGEVLVGLWLPLYGCFLNKNALQSRDLCLSRTRVLETNIT